MTILSQTAEYALRAVVCLVQDGHEPKTRDAIAAETRIPSQYLAKVLRLLVESSLIQVQRGPGGGFKLIRKPEKITVFDVVSAVDPVRRIKECPLGNPSHVKLCPLHKRLDEVATLAEQALRDTTIAALIPQAAMVNRCRFPKK